MPASITLTVSHLPTSTSFFLSCLQPLNYVYRGRINDTIGFGHPDAAPDFWITQSVPGVPPGPAHVAFPATSRQTVHEFYMNAIKAGGRVHGEPALRDIPTGYYSAAIIDFDGNSIEAVFRPDLMEENKENMADHPKSTVSMAKSSTKSKAPSVVSSTSKASKAKTVTPTEVRSVAPSGVQGSSVSKSPSQARSVATSAAPRSSISQSVSPPKRNGDFIDNILSEAKGTISVAKELVNQARPHLTDSSTIDRSPDSHGPSDAIVGTLLGVAAGAALHYAFANRNNNNSASAPPSRRNTPPQSIGRSETAPSWTEERYHYYHNQPQMQAIESTSRHSHSPLMIEMIDNEPTYSEYTSTVRPRRRSSLSAIDAKSRVSTARTNATSSNHSRRFIEAAAPPTSYRGPTASTQLSQRKQSTSSSSTTSSSSPPKNQSTRSRTSSQSRSSSHRHSHRLDEGYASASESRSHKSSSHSHSKSKSTSKSTTPSRTNSTRQSKSNHSVVTSIKSPEFTTPLPPSRASTWTSTPKSTTSPRSTTSKSSYKTTHTHSTSPRDNNNNNNNSAISQLTTTQLKKLERDRGDLSDVTRSVVGKVKEIEKLGVSDREVGPGDSVSQVSSVRSGRR